jgi:thiol-disulfide isomerase/thioredoxin
MKIKIIIPILLLLSASFCMAQEKFQISGKFSEIGKGYKVVLNYKNSEGKDVKDSATVTNGKFALNGITAFGNRASLSLLPENIDSIRRGAQTDFQVFYLEKGKYTLAGTSNMAKATITGGQAQKDYLLYNSQMSILTAQYQELVKRYFKAKSAKDDAEIKNIQAEGKPLGVKMAATLDSFIFSHPDSYVSLDLIFNEKATVIDPEVFDRYYKPLSERVLGSFTGQKLVAKYEKARQIFIGQNVDFTQEDTLGKLFKLSSLRGKYVLIDFWASWCAPCRAENPNLLKAYRALKDKQFEIVSISLDDNKKSWLKAVEMDKLPWEQVSDLKGWKNELAIKYGISAVPQNFLLDPNGKIIAKNLRGEDLYTKLSGIMEALGKQN